MVVLVMMAMVGLGVDTTVAYGYPAAIHMWIFVIVIRMIRGAAN